MSDWNLTQVSRGYRPELQQRLVIEIAKMRRAVAISITCDSSVVKQSDYIPRSNSVCVAMRRGVAFGQRFLV